MDYYLQITVLPDPEFKATTLMSALFSKLHRALVSVGQGEIGISFPKADKSPGEVLRLHGSEAALYRLMDENWLKGLRDYTEVSKVDSIPNQVQHIQVKRKRPKLTASRLRRAVKRGAISEEQAEELLMEDNKEQIENPYFRLQSQSTNQNFPLFIEQSQPQEDSVSGSFNAYGISQTATVPWFP